MQIRYSNISVLAEMIIVGVACLYIAITSFLHYEYSIHSQVACIYCIYAILCFAVLCWLMWTTDSLTTLRLSFCSAAAAAFLAVAVTLLLWYSFVRNTVDRLFHTTLITSSPFWYEHFWCLIILIKLLFLEWARKERKKGTCRSWRRRRRENIFFMFLCAFLLSLVFAFGRFIMNDSSMRTFFFQHEFPSFQRKGKSFIFVEIIFEKRTQIVTK